MSCSVLHLWTNGDNITHLAEPLLIEGSHVGVVSIHGKIDLPRSWSIKPLFLCCNFIEGVYLRHLKLPILTQFTTNSKGFVNSSIGHVTWVKARISTLAHPRLYICNENGEMMSFSGRGVYCTLHIQHPDGFYN